MYMTMITHGWMWGAQWQDKKKQTNCNTGNCRQIKEKNINSPQRWSDTGTTTTTGTIGSPSLAMLKTHLDKVWATLSNWTCFECGDRTRGHPEVLSNLKYSMVWHFFLKIPFPIGDMLFLFHLQFIYPSLPYIRNGFKIKTRILLCDQ